MPFSVTPLPACSVVVPVPAWRMLMGSVKELGIVTVFALALVMRKIVLPSLSVPTVPTV